MILGDENPSTVQDVHKDIPLSPPIANVAETDSQVNQLTSLFHIYNIDNAADTADAEPSGNLLSPSMSHKYDIDAAAEAWGEDDDANDSGNNTNVSNLILMLSCNLNSHHLDRFKVNNIKSPLLLTL